jgi:hypothetical protein
MHAGQQYEMLVDSLQLVAASSEQQTAALPAFVCATDEISTTFGDAFLLVPQLHQAGLVPDDGVSALRQLDTFLASCPNVGDIVERQSLKTHPYWEEARKLATRALEALGEAKKMPRVRHAAWVRGGPNCP